MKSLSVIFPAFNEEANIRAVVEDAYRNIRKFTPVFEIIVVNDGSKDRTGEICDRLAEELSNVRVVHHVRNRGYGAALKSGIERARYDLIFFTDADGQFDLNEVASKSSAAMSSTVFRSSVWARWLTPKSSLRQPGLA